MKRLSTIILCGVWFFLAQSDSISKSLFQVGPFPNESECESYRKETEKTLMVFTVRCFNAAQ